MNRDPAIEEAILHPELRHINFFNGRLLTGGDLEAEQRVLHTHARHLGSAIGAGVAFGLEVSRGDESPPGGPVLVVSAGLALNRAGQTLRLECDQRVALTVPPDQAAEDQCVFDDCLKTPGGTLASGIGYYVLTIAPASRPDGKAPVSGLGSGLAICNSRFLAEGVKFRVYRLALTLESGDRARGRLAQACFGLVPEIATGDWSAALRAEYGWQTLMPPAFAANLEVALAVFEWNNAGLGLLKLWPVRRRLARAASAVDWAYFTSDRRVTEGEAMFLNFQEDLAEFTATGASGTALTAANRFAFLPAGGVLPGGVAWRAFLGALAPLAVTPIDAALWPRLLQETFTREPVAVPATDGSADTVLAALKVYQVPGRAEVLFTRSPLGRLRLFAKLGVNSRAVVIRPADGSLRCFSLVNTTSGPLIVDDLPGGDAELCLVLADAQDLRAKQPDFDEAKNADNTVKEAIAKFQQSMAKANLIVNPPGRAGTVKVTVKELLAALQSMSAAIESLEEARQAQNQASEARATAEKLRTAAEKAATQPGMGTAGTAFFDTGAGTVTPETLQRLLRAAHLVAQAPVVIVNGRTTDATLTTKG